MAEPMSVPRRKVPYEEYIGGWVQINVKNSQTYYGLVKQITGEDIVLTPYLDYVPNAGTKKTHLKIISKKGFTSKVPLEAVSRIAHSDLTWLEQMCINYNDDQRKEASKKPNN